MPNNNVAILSIMSKFDEKSAREAAKRADKVYEEALSDIGNVNFDKKLIENFDKAMNLLKNKFKKVNLSSYTNSLLDSIFSDKDIKEKSKDIELFISKIEMLKKASSGQDINAFNTFSAKQIDALISRTEKFAQKQEEINEKTREYNREATKIAKANRSISTIDKNYGNQDYSKTLESLKKSLGTEKEFTAEQNQSIENLAKMVNLYQIMEKSEPQKGTAEAIRYSKDLLAVTHKIKEERDKIDAFSQKGASTYIANNGLSSVDKVSDYTVNKSKEDFVKASLSNLKSQEAKLQSELTTYISDSVQKNLAKVSKEVDAVVDKAEKRVENLQNKIESLQAKPTKTDSDNSIIGNIVSDGTEQELKNINNELSQIGNQDTSDLELMDKALENIKDNFQDVIKYAVDAETAFNKINELYKKFNKKGELEKSELIDIVSFNDRLNMLDQKGLSNDKYIINNEDMLDDLDFWADKYGKNIDRIQKMTIEQIEEAEKLKSIQNEAVSNSNDSQTKQLVKQEEQIKQTSRRKLLDTQDKLSSNTKISVDAEQAIADINKIKESLNSIPEEKNIKITVSDSDYTNTPLLSDAEGNTITAFRGVVGAWSGLINQDGIGFFTDKLKLAADYADSLAESGKVYQANLSFKNPLEVEGNGAKWDEIDFNGVKKTTDEIVELAKQLGHDGVIFKNIRDGFTDTDEDISNVMVALNAAQIKNEQVIRTVKAGTGEMVDVASKIDNATDTATNSTVESQNKIQEELKETQKVAEQVSEAISKVNTNNVSFTQENSELDAKISDVEKLNNSVKELISNSGDYKVGEIVDWDDTKKLLSTVQELDNYDVLKSLGLSEGAIQEEEGKIKEFVQTIKYQYDEFVNAWNKQDDDDIFSWSDSIRSNLNELNSYIDSLISSYKQLNDISSVSDKSNISSGNELEIIDSEELIILDDIIEKEEKVIETTKEMYRAFNSSHGVSGKNGISWFASDLSDATSYLDIGNTNKDSVAKLIADTSKFLTVDAKGAQWGEILYEGIERTTDEIAEMAKQAGYVGVEFKNIQDSYNGISDNGNSVFAIFDDNLLKNITDYTETARKKVSEIKEITSYVNDKLYENFDGSSVSIFDNVRSQFDSVIDLVKDGIFDIETAFTEVDNIVERFKKNPIEDTFQGDKIEQATTSAKELDKTLEQAEETSKTIEKIISAYRGVDDKELIGKQSKNYGGKTFFTTSKELASEYGSEVFKADLLFKNLLDFDAEGSNWNKIKVPKIIEDYLNNIIDLSKEKINEAKIELKNIIGDGFQDIPFDKLLIKTNAINGETSLKKGYHKYANNFEEYWGQIKTIFEGLDNEEPIKIALEKLYNAMKLATSNMLQVVNNNNIIDVIGRKDGRYATDQIIGLAEKLGYDGTLIRNVYDNPASSNKEILDNILVAFSKNQFQNISPIKDVFQGNDNSNTSFSSNLDEIEKEKSALLGLRNTVSLIIEEIDRKTQAFHNEKSAVDLIIPKEIATLESLERELKIIIESIEQISKIPINIDFNLENLDEKSANVISKLKDSLSGFNGSSLTNISSILEGFKISKANVENLQKLANAILTLKSNLNNVGNSGQQFLSDIKELVAQSDGLKDLATVLKSTQKQIDNAKKTTNANVDSKNTEENANTWKELTYSIQRYSEVSKRISSGKALEGDVEEASRLENKISQLQKLDILSPTQIEKSKQMLTKLYDTLDDIEKKSKETTLKSLNSSIDKYRNDYNSRSSKPFTDNQSDQYKKLLANYETSIIELEAYRDKIRNNPLVSKEDLNQIDELTKKVKKNATAFNNLTASQKGSTPLSRGKTIEWANDLLEQNSKWSKKAKLEVQGWINKLATADPSNVEEIRNRILEIVRAEREAGNAGKTWLDIFSTKKLHHFLGQAASMFSFYDLVNVGREAFNVIKDLDSAYTEMRKVSDETAQSLKNFQSASFDVAKQVGVTALEIQNSTADFMRLGYSLKEASKLSEDANIYANVGDMDISEATEHMISSIQAWKSEFSSVTEASTNIIDRYNEVNFLPLCA